MAHVNYFSEFTQAALKIIGHLIFDTLSEWTES